MCIFLYEMALIVKKCNNCRSINDYNNVDTMIVKLIIILYVFKQRVSIIFFHLSFNYVVFLSLYKKKV